jgi:TolB protein
MMNANGTGAKQLTRGPNREATPEWSQDGTKIVFGRSENGEAIYTMSADGSNVKRISPTPGRDVLPDWSPDGSQIVFTRVIEPRGNDIPITSIMVMNVDGTGAKTLFENNSFNMEPRFSPDGAKIIFMCGAPGVGIEICQINSDGTNFKKITDERGVVYGDPHWSHDGTKIAFGSNREGGGKLNIYTMNADGSNMKQITHFLPPYEAGDTGWSPDDKLIAFEWDVNGKSQSDPAARAEVWIVNADGSGEPASTHQACSGVGCGPRFQP